MCVCEELEEAFSVMFKYKTKHGNIKMTKISCATFSKCFSLWNPRKLRLTKNLVVRKMDELDFRVEIQDIQLLFGLLNHCKSTKQDKSILAPVPTRRGQWRCITLLCLLVNRKTNIFTSRCYATLSTRPLNATETDRVAKKQHFAQLSFSVDKGGRPY